MQENDVNKKFNDNNPKKEKINQDRIDPFCIICFQKYQEGEKMKLLACGHKVLLLVSQFLH